MAVEQNSLFDDYLANRKPEPDSILEIHEKVHLEQDSLVLEVNKFDYEIKRSKRRKKSVGAYRERGKTIIVAPVRMSNKEVQIYAAELIAELNERDQKLSAQEVLEQRARYLSEKYLDIDVFAFESPKVSIKWVTNQNSRWGSCSPDERQIRISHRLQGMPQYVIDAVIFHELIHLIIPDHSQKFYEYLSAFSDYEMAKEYLAGYSFAQQNFRN